MRAKCRLPSQWRQLWFEGDMAAAVVMSGPEICPNPEPAESVATARSRPRWARNWPGVRGAPMSRPSAEAT
jgi:hypothetical protein